MGLTSATISNASIDFTANLQTLSPLTESLPVALTVGFASVANLSVYTGSFTPANNTKIVVTGIPPTSSPNFFCFMCDQPALLNTDNSFLVNVPINKILFGTMASIQGGVNPIAQFYLNGSSSAAYPMAQGTACNYTLVIAQGIIT